MNREQWVCGCAYIHVYMYILYICILFERMHTHWGLGTTMWPCGTGERAEEGEWVPQERLGASRKMEKLNLEARLGLFQGPRDLSLGSWEY